MVVKGSKSSVLTANIGQTTTPTTTSPPPTTTTSLLQSEITTIIPTTENPQETTIGSTTIQDSDTTNLPEMNENVKLVFTTIMPFIQESSRKINHFNAFISS